MARKRPGLVALRRVLAVVFAFVGLFVTFFGLGFGRPSVVLTGVAVMLLSATSRLVTTLRGTLRQWVVGVGKVVYVSDPPPSAPYGRCQLELIVDAPGLPQETVAIREPRVPVEVWPSPGDELTIEVAADDIRNVRILWPDSVPAEEPDPTWDDDQPRPAPAEPPGSHLHPPPHYHRDPDRDGLAEDLLGDWEDTLDDRADALDAVHRAGAPDRGRVEEEIDFDLDGPPAGPKRTTPVGAGDTSPPDEGRLGRHVPLAQHPAPDPPARVPAPRPSPRPRPHPRPRAVTPATAPQEPAPYPSANPTAGGAIHRLGVTLLVADLDRSAAFYRDRLGFHQVDAGPDSVVLASGETRLVLRELQEMDPVHRRVAHLNLEVADIDTVHAELKAAGVKFTYPPRVVDHGTRLVLWAAAFKDPDGHGIALTQWRPRDGATPVSGSTGGGRPRP